MKMKVNGTLAFQGDKSLSHRAAILAAAAQGESTIRNFLTAGDTIHTLKAMETAGITITGDPKSGEFTVQSPGLAGLSAQAAQKGKLNVDLGNSGTGSRLLLGLFCGLEGVTAQIDGDASLRKRPMQRITDPLMKAGAHFEPMDRLPIETRGKRLLPIIHRESIGSAQVKSALMFAALASGTTLRLEEPIPSRDHTENMMLYAGVDLVKEKTEQGYLIEMEPPYELKPREYNIWGDISSASFFVVLALLTPGSCLTIENVLLNPHRDRYLHVLREMGGDIEIREKEMQCGERGGDIIVKSSDLKGIEIQPQDIPALIDELPILTIAGLFAEGNFTYRNAAELRVKESDRISSMVTNLKAIGAEVVEFEDGLSLRGNRDGLLQGQIQSFLDHRIVMAFEIAKLIGLSRSPDSKMDIEGKEWVATSFPDFYRKIETVCNVAE